MNVVLWLLLGYCIGAAAFYRFIVTAAEEEPIPSAAEDTNDFFRDREGMQGKAA